MCNIQYTSLVFNETDRTITLSGTATGCAEVVVDPTSPNFADPKTAVVDASGNWSVVYNQNEILVPLTVVKERCGIGCKVVVFCKNDRTCKGPGDVLLTCTGGGGNCPEVELTVTPGACANGRRTVHLRAEVRSANDAFYTWFFGTDEDNQLGEDSVAGGWLPPANSQGLRIVEIDHVYQPEGNQPQNVTVKITTSSGPANECTAEKTFSLEPCSCNLTVAIEVLDNTGAVVSVNDCVPAGNYRVRVTNPTTGNFNWSLNGTADDSQVGNTFNVSLNDGDEKSITVFVLQGGCSGSNGKTIRACKKDGPPVDCQVSEWSAWSRCQNNQQTRTRTVITQPSNGGQSCPVLTETRRCTDDNTSTSCDFCCIWFTINIIAIFATLVAFVIAGCVFQLVEPISLGIAISLAVATTASIIAWGIVCGGRSGNSCVPILRWMDILDALTVLAGIVAFLMGVVTPCAIAFWINVGFLQWARRILQTIAVIGGCSPNPWWRR